MNNKYRHWYSFLLVLLGLLLATNAEAKRRRSRRAGAISQTLANSASSQGNAALRPSVIKLAQFDNLASGPKTDPIGSLKQDQKTKHTIGQNLEDPNNDEPDDATAVADVAAALPEQGDIPHKKHTLAEVESTLKLPLELQTASNVFKEREEHKIKSTLDTLDHEEEEEKIELHFEDADLQNFVRQIEDLFTIKFISDESILPLKQGSKTIKGNKISFKTNKPLTKKETWNLFLSFLNIAGFTVIPQPHNPQLYRIEGLEAARKAPLPTYIGVNYTTLPDNDEFIRYVYFIENSTIDALKGVVTTLSSSSAGSTVFLQESKGFILTDKSYNIKTLMKIVKELDQVTMPQSMSILKLHRADAQQVKALYESLTQTDDKNPIRPLTTRKQPTSLYFPESARIIAEPRNNYLILLGPQDAIKRIEDFVIKHIDVELDQPYSPLYVYQLKYADAGTIAEIMNNVAQFGKDTPAGKSGGVRGEDKYLKQVTFTPEKDTNRLIIKADYDDYLKVRDIIAKLDEQQPQVAIEVLILSISISNQQALGVQLRSKLAGTDGLLGQNVKFQTSGLRGGPTPLTPEGIVENPNGPGVTRLLGNLLNLVTNAGPGNTIVTLGQDILGVWGILQLLETMTNLQVISNPFIIATNKTPAVVSVGETRRVVTGTIIGTADTPTFGDDNANLVVNITPQINSDGMIVLKLSVEITEFVEPLNFTSGTKRTKKIVTETVVADKEVLALGDIPVLGWLFKNQFKAQDKESLLILISSRIIEAKSTEDVNKFTQERVKDYHGTLDSMHDVSEKHDPIHKLFFASNNSVEKVADDFLFKRHREFKQRKNKKRRGNRFVKETDTNKPVAAPSQPATKVPAQPPQTTGVPSNTAPSNTEITLRKQAVPPPPPQKMPVVAKAPDNKLKIKLKEKRADKVSLTKVLSKPDTEPSA